MIFSIASGIAKGSILSVMLGKKALDMTSRGLTSKFSHGITKVTAGSITKTGSALKKITIGSDLEGGLLIGKHTLGPGDFLPYRMTGLGIATATIGGALVNGGDELIGSYNAMYIGRTSADQMSRLTSVDSSGIIEASRQLSRGNRGVQQEILASAFDTGALNTYGARGDLVFALHNLREG